MTLLAVVFLAVTTTLVASAPNWEKLMGKANRGSRSTSNAHHEPLLPNKDPEFTREEFDQALRIMEEHLQKLEEEREQPPLFRGHKVTNGLPEAVRWYYAGTFGTNCFCSAVPIGQELEKAHIFIVAADCAYGWIGENLALKKQSSSDKHYAVAKAIWNHPYNEGSPKVVVLKIESINTWNPFQSTKWIGIPDV